MRTTMYCANSVKAVGDWCMYMGMFLRATKGMENPSTSNAVNASFLSRFWLLRSHSHRFFDSTLAGLSGVCCRTDESIPSRQARKPLFAEQPVA